MTDDAKTIALGNAIEAISADSPGVPLSGAAVDLTEDMQALLRLRSSEEDDDSPSADLIRPAHRRIPQRVVVQKTDDIDGSEATQTVTFAIDGTAYEIDLNEGNAGDLRAAIKPYAAAGRRTSGAGRAASTKAVKGAQDYDPKAARAWPASRKISIPARGRIPSAVVEQYRSAGN